MPPSGSDLLDTIPVAIGVSHDVGSTVITGNRYFAELLGLDPSANASLSAPVDERPTSYAMYRNGRKLSADELPLQLAARTNESVSDWEADIVRDDGKRIAVLGHAVPIRDSDGTACGSIGVFLDVSERKREETSRLSAERRVREVIDEMSDAFGALDRDWRFTYVNDRYVQLAGISREDLIGKVVWDVFPPAAQLRVHDEALRAMKENRPVVVEEYYAPLDRWLETRMYPTPDGLASFITDITDRRRIAREREQLLAREQAARVEAERGRQRATFLAQLGAALARSRQVGQIVKTVADFAVPRLADECAVDLADDHGKLERVAVAHVDPDKVAVVEELRRWLERLESPYGPASVVRTNAPAIVSRVADHVMAASAPDADGRMRFVRASGFVSYLCVPLVAHGRTLGALTCATAESGREYSEDDLHFAEQVAARAALGIDNARAYDKLQTANRLKDEFLATLSHELRTPLNAILGYSRMLHSGMIPAEKQLRAIEILERNASSLTQIVNDVLDVSRIVSGKIRLNVQPVDLPVIVNDVVASVLPAAEAKGVRMETVIDPDVPPVSGDPDRLQQVVWNVVSNAVKFTGRGGRVEVRVEAVDADLDVVVSDSGIGIRPEFLPHIFERFRQADSGSAREHGGLGLGLAIARHLVEMHGGTIDAASAGEGHGARFRVRLPQRTGQAELPREDRRAHPSAERTTAAEAPVDLSGIRVLAVDDDPDALRMMREILQLAGAKVTGVDSGLKALQAITLGPPDVLLADIGLPSMDGYELIAGIRRLTASGAQHLPAAAVTAYARAEDRAKALRSGFDMHLSKPVDPGELIAAVATLAAKHR